MKKFSFEKFAAKAISVEKQKSLKGGRYCTTLYYNDDGFAFDEAGECGGGNCEHSGATKYASMGFAGNVSCTG